MFCSSLLYSFVVDVVSRIHCYYCCGGVMFMQAVAQQAFPRHARGPVHPEVEAADVDEVQDEVEAM